MAHVCEKCGGSPAQPFHAFELESWETKDQFVGEKEIYYLCLPCFDQLTNESLQTDEVKKKRAENRINLEKAIAEGIVCPTCKMLILEENHICDPS